MARLDPSAGSFDWAVRAGSSSSTIDEYVAAITRDSLGTSYITGAAGGNAEFDPFTLPTNIWESSAYVAKLDATGKFTSVVGIKAQYANSIALGPSGDIYVAGGLGYSTSSPRIQKDNVIVVANTSWTAMETSDESLHVNRVVVDAKGNSVISGAFKGRVQFGPDVLTTGTADVMGYLARLNPEGRFTAAEQISAKEAVAIGLARDKTGGLHADHPAASPWSSPSGPGAGPPGTRFRIDPTF